MNRTLAATFAALLLSTASLAAEREYTRVGIRDYPPAQAHAIRTFLRVKGLRGIPHGCVLRVWGKGDPENPLDLEMRCKHLRIGQGR